MELIIKWLATLFEAFKAKNPLVATIILVLVATAMNGVENGQLFGWFTIPEWLEVATQYVGTFILAVTGSQTFRYLPAEKKATAR